MRSTPKQGRVRAASDGGLYWPHRQRDGATQLHLLLIDDHALFREGLKFLLRGLDEHLLIDEAGSMAAAIARQDVDPST